MTRREQPSLCLPARIAAAACLGLLLFAGCQQKMAQQPSYRPDDPCAYFPDGTSSRQLVAGAVARGYVTVDAELHTGRQSFDESMPPRVDLQPTTREGDALAVLTAEAAQFQGVVNEFPFSVTRDVIEHGRNRYMIYCVVCHDPAGTGHGKIVERGYTRPPSYHTARLREAPVGHMFRVVTHGYGSMPSYAAQISPRDRWAIVAYVRALQLSQHFPIDKLPDDMREEWNKNRLAATAGGPEP